jgi:DNA-binding CsgD family transcriptional regulator
MTALRERDHERIRLLEEALLVLRLDGVSGLERTLQDLRRLIEAEQLTAWAVVDDETGPRVTFSVTVSAPLAGPGEQKLEVQVCDGPLSAWIAAFQEEPFTARQEALLRALLPALGRRFTAESRVEAAQLADAAIAAALEAIQRPAFLLRGDGTIHRMNGAARVLAASSGQQRLAEDLRAGLQHRSDVLDVVPLDALARHAAFLVVYRQEGADPRARLARKVAEWELTKRQAEVLGRLVLGESNKGIAAHVGCAVNTVELHVTEILRRSRCGSRAELIAAFWRSP